MNKFLPLMILITVSTFAGVDVLAAEGEQRTVMITGANRGIGFEFVKQYAEKGYRVIATCRSPGRADELAALAAGNDDIVVEQLDLIDLDGIDALAKKYSGQPIDVLVNNGALMRGPDKGQSFGSMDYEEFDVFFNTNVKGPLKVTEAFWPNVAASEEKMVAQLTTSQGRQGIPIAGFAYYKSSKAAIDNLYIDIARQGRKEGIHVVTLIPGRVATHGEKPNKSMTPIETSIAGMIGVMESHELKQNGKSFWWNGSESKN